MIINNLLAPLQVIAPAIGSKVIQILTNVKLAPSEDGELLLTATNLEMQISTICQGDHANEPAFLIDYQKLLAYAKINAALNISVQGEQVKITGKTRATIKSEPADHYPEMSYQQEADQAIKLPASALSHAIDKVIYAAGISDVRFYLNGILFQSNKGQISITASDGHRLAMARWQTDATIDIESIIPVKTAQALTRTFSAGDIDLQLGRNAISVKNDANHLIGKCIDAKYPSFDKVFALARNNIAKLDSKALQEAIEAVAITADNKYHGIQCQFDQQLTLTATNGLGETSDITLEIDYSGKPLTLGFCARYLKEALTKIDGQATLSIDDNASSLLLHGSDDSAVHVVMPMRI